MAENTKIEWSHHTFNPVVGCQKVGPGCDNCYAEGWSKRSGLVKWGAGEPRRITSDTYWRQPLKWDRAAAALGERHRVFCASLADVFDNAWPAGVRERLFDLIRSTPNLDWLLLTKRPGNIARMLPPDWGAGYPNVWLGCTIVNQVEADRDVPKLLSVRSRVHFLSCEPLLGPLVLRGVSPDGQRCWNWLTGVTGTMHPDGPDFYVGPKIHWVICGGESGPWARPMHPDWARSLRDQCQAAGVPFLFKQWGEWAEDRGRFGVVPDCLMNGSRLFRIGKKRAGRLLDGRTWDEVPNAA